MFYYLFRGKYAIVALLIVVNLIRIGLRYVEPQDIIAMLLLVLLLLPLVLGMWKRSL